MPMSYRNCNKKHNILHSALLLMFIIHQSFSLYGPRRTVSCIFSKCISPNSYASQRETMRKLSSHNKNKAIVSESKEYLLVPDSNTELNPAIEKLFSLRPSLTKFPLSKIKNFAEVKKRGIDSNLTLRWVVFRKGLCIDSTILEPQSLGKMLLNANETASIWQSHLDRRSNLMNQCDIDLGDGGKYQKELNEAIAIVQRVSYASRSLQQKVASPSKSEISGVTITNKRDLSPVTVADFGAQAMILRALKKAFPNDAMIAEEDSTYLRSRPNVTQEVLSFIEAALGERWSPEELFSSVDLGSSHSTTANSRTWILDPIDGTKGFIRSQHFCIALGLLVNAKPTLSVLGCPSINLMEALSHKREVNPMFIPSPLSLKVDEMPDEELKVFDSNQGSVFYAVSGMGAYARSLDMPLGGSFEISASNRQQASQATLCERYVPTKEGDDIANYLGIAAGTAIHMDGQGKHCLVACGRAEGSLRLPNRSEWNEREKIWDHIPGYHLVAEAGGRVTDLQGRDLDFSLGRELAHDVDGVVVSNSILHDSILDAVHAIRNTNSSGAFNQQTLYT